MLFEGKRVSLRGGSKCEEPDEREESSVSDCLSVRSHFIMLVVGQVDVTRLQRCEDGLDELDMLFRRAVLDDDLRDVMVSTNTHGDGRGGRTRA
jgi:hypothetical protein